MAKQCGEIVIVGTIDNLCFYEMNGKYYVRTKPGPDRKQFLTQAKYKDKKQAGEWMVKAARTTSSIYHQIPKDQRSYKLYCGLQKQAFWHLREGKDEAMIKEELIEYLVNEGIVMLNEQCSMSNIQLRKKAQRVKDIDHFSGVKIKYKEGKWIHLYHRDELELLKSFRDQIKAGEEWLPLFLIKRKELPTYRLKHRYRRKKRASLKRMGLLHFARNDDRSGFQRCSTMFNTLQQFSTSQPAANNQ